MKGVFLGMEKKAGLFEDVYGFILEQIFQQKLSYGQKIQEEAISQALGISRTPIREALRKLESDGLVEILPKQSAKIVTLTEKDVKQLGAVKLQLDFLTAQMAIFHGSNADFKRLEQINEELAHALRENDSYHVLKKDMAFQRAYTQISGNPILSSLQAQLQLKTALYQSVKWKELPHMMNDSLYHHQAIIESLYARDVDRILRCIIPYISTSYGIDANVYSMMVVDFSVGRTPLPYGAERMYAAPSGKKMSNF